VLETTANFGAAGTYVLKLEASDGALRTSDEVTVEVEEASTYHQVQFQQNNEPTDDYQGIIDTFINVDAADQNYGAQNYVQVRGAAQRTGLFRWDLSSIPSGSTVGSVKLQFNVSDASPNKFEIFELKRRWLEHETTWNSAAAGEAWEVPGALGPSDAGSAVLGKIQGATSSYQMIKLNVAGEAAVQAWIDHPELNHGMVMRGVPEGTNLLKLEAKEYRSPMLILTFIPPQNEAPQVNVGPDQTIYKFEEALLEGVVTDDGIPFLENPLRPGSPTLRWSKVSGPGNVSFAEDRASETTATFSAAGTYVLKLEAFDRELRSSDEISIEVQDAATYHTVQFRQGSLPEQSYSGAVDTFINSRAPTTIYGATNGVQITGSPQAAGLFKWDLSLIPEGSIVGSVKLNMSVYNSSLDRFEVYELKRDWVETEASWNIAAAADNWELPGALGDTDAGQTVLGTRPAASGASTFALKLNGDGESVVQSWIDDPDSNKGFIIRGDADSTDMLGIKPKETGYYYAPLLTITFIPPDNQAPVVDAGQDQLLYDFEQAMLEGSVADDGAPFQINPFRPANVSISWSKGSGPGSVSFADYRDPGTTASFSEPGSYVLRLQASDGTLQATDEVSITVESSAALSSASFQRGVQPDGSYDGVRDTFLFQRYPDRNYRNNNYLVLRGNKGLVGLIKWDLSSIEPGSQIVSAEFHYRVNNSSRNSYQLYAVKRGWEEGQVSWNRATSSESWEVAGAQGAGDSGQSVLGELKYQATKAALNTVGEAVVQSWVDDPASNHGLLIRGDAAATDNLKLYSSNYGYASYRPQLVIRYIPPESE